MGKVKSGAMRPDPHPPNAVNKARDETNKLSPPHREPNEERSIPVLAAKGGGSRTCLRVACSTLMGWRDDSDFRSDDK